MEGFMPLLLTTPLSTGSLDPNCSSYDYVKIMKFEHNAIAHYICLQVQWGTVVEGKWVAGIKPPVFFEIRGADYYAAMTEMPLEGETAYQATSRLLYQQLVN